MPGAQKEHECSGSTVLTAVSDNNHTDTIYIYIHTYVYDGLPKCLFLVWLINRNSLGAASYSAFKTMTMTDLNSLKPCILSFMFEAVAKTCG